MQRDRGKYVIDEDSKEITVPQQWSFRTRYNFAIKILRFLQNSSQWR